MANKWNIDCFLSLAIEAPPAGNTNSIALIDTNPNAASQLAS